MTLTHHEERAVRTATAGRSGHVRIGLPATAAGRQVAPGTVAYDATGVDAGLVVEQVDPAATPGMQSSVRSLITIASASAPTRYEFMLNLSSGAALEKRSDGSVVAFSPRRQVLGLFGAPWAVDARGTRMPTEFEIRGNTLVQHVDHQGAVYPVVADPWWFVPIAVVGARALVRVVVNAGTKQAARRAATRAVVASGKTIRYVYSPVRGNFFTARGFTLRWYAIPRRQDGYPSFRAFKRAEGNAKEGYEWHHIVEQRMIGRNGIRRWQVHNKQNLIMIRRGIHRRCVSALYGTRIKNLTRNEREALTVDLLPVTRNMTVRQYLDNYSFRNAHTVGLQALSLCGVRGIERP
jgi:hypothetical protein